MITIDYTRLPLRITFETLKRCIDNDYNPLDDNDFKDSFFEVKSMINFQVTLGLRTR